MKITNHIYIGFKIWVEVSYNDSNILQTFYLRGSSLSLKRVYLNNVDKIILLILLNPDS